MNDLEKIELLKNSLLEYKYKWEDDKNRLHYAIEHGDYDSFEEVEDMKKVIIQKNSMAYLAQWIINSINGGIDKAHGTNICNIILKDNE